MNNVSAAVKDFKNYCVYLMLTIVSKNASWFDVWRKFSLLLLTFIIIIIMYVFRR